MTDSLLQEQREKIDAIDSQIRELLFKRLDCSYKVAQAKQEEGSTTVYRADREAQILERLGADVPDDRKAEYLAVVRKIMEASRMYQYGLLFDWNDNAFALVKGHELASCAGEHVLVRLSRPNKPNAMAALLSMVGDYGFDMERMELVEADENHVVFDLLIAGDISTEHMQKLFFQLSKESDSFQILENRA